MPRGVTSISIIARTAPPYQTRPIIPRLSLLIMKVGGMHLDEAVCVKGERDERQQPGSPAIFRRGKFDRGRSRIFERSIMALKPLVHA